MRKTILALLVTLFSGQMYANDLDTLQVDLSVIQVVAPAQKFYSELGRVIHTIDKREIQTMPVRSLDDLLETFTGVDIRNRGVGNTQADISIRGGSFDQVLILLNGVNITDPQTGHHNLNIPIDLADVERVEFLQGSSARLLGPNAFSGAINIVTATHAGNKVNARLSAGSYGTFQQAVSASIGRESYSMFASTSRTTSEGHIANTDFENQNSFLHLQYHTPTVGSFGLQLSELVKDFGANSFYTKTYPNQFEHIQTQMGAVDWKLNLNNLKLSAHGYLRNHYDRFELFRDKQNAASWYVNHNYHLTQVSGAKALASYSTNAGKFSFNWEQRREHIISTVLGEAMAQPIANKKEDGIFFEKSKTRNINNIAFDYSLFLSKFYVSAGFAFNNSTDFGWHNNWGLDLGYQLTQHARLFAALNTAVRLPTFTDLYYKSATHRANPDLQPEKSISTEMGFKFEKHRLKVDMTAFYQMGHHIIDWVVMPNNTFSESKNLTELNTKGIEISSHYKPNSRFLSLLALSYAFVDQDKIADGFDSRYVLDYLRHKLTFNLKHRIYRQLQLNWWASYNDRNGTYTDFATGDVVDYKSYLLLNVRLEAPSKQFTVFVDANNLTNQPFVDYAGLSQPGRHFNAGIRFHLQ